MSISDASAAPRPDKSPGGWLGSIMLGIVLGALYLANGRDGGTFDTVPSAMLTLTIVRGEGLYLDRFFPLAREPRTQLPTYVRLFDGHVVSRYPVGPALLSLPLVAPQVAYYDRFDPGWDRNARLVFERTHLMVRRAMSILVALTAVVLHRLLKKMGFGLEAWVAVVAAFLGSTLWSVASRALWQHGPAALALTLTALILLPRPASRWRLMAAGLTAASLTAFRAIDVVFSAAVFLWLLRENPRRIGWFLPAPLLIGALLLGTNYWYFGTLEGGQAELEKLHPKLHGVNGVWTGDLRTGLAGTLLSPSRGLFVYCPWVALTLAFTPFFAKRIARWPLICWLLWSLVPYGFMLSKYSVWWGGHSFGPRYWTDAMPLFAILLAFALRWSWETSRAITALFALTIAFSVAVNAVGAFLFPSNWNLSPANVDTHHERLWDWHDTEIRRCLEEAFPTKREALSPSFRGR